jgi:hypothetical protein
MFQKLAPLLILAMFAIGAYFMIQGMHSAMDLSDHKKVKAQKE